MECAALRLPPQSRSPLFPPLWPRMPWCLLRTRWQAGGITCPAAMQAAAAACHGLHQGMDVMGAMEAMGVGTDAMATDAMAPATK